MRVEWRNILMGEIALILRIMEYGDRMAGKWVRVVFVRFCDDFC